MMSSGTNNKYKTVMCKHFEQTGHCYLEARCHFAHGKEELRKLSDPLPENKDQGEEDHKAFQSFPSYGGPSPVSNYKTMKCKFFEKGHCRYEQNCSYAHGDEDVRASNISTPQNIVPAMQMGNMMGYYDPTFQNQLVQQQVQYLIEQIEKIHAQDQELSKQIHDAKETNKSGNYQTAASVVYGIMNRSNKSREESEQYNTIMQSLQNGGNAGSYYQQMQMQMQYQNPAAMYGYGAQAFAPQMMGMIPGMSAGYPYGGMGGMYMGNNYQNRPYKQNYKSGGGYGGGRNRYNKGDSEENREGQDKDEVNGETENHESGDMTETTDMMEGMQISGQQQNQSYGSNFRGGRGGQRYGGNTRGRRFNQNQ